MEAKAYMSVNQIVPHKQVKFTNCCRLISIVKDSNSTDAEFNYKWCGCNVYLLFCFFLNTRIVIPSYPSTSYENRLGEAYVSNVITYNVIRW